MEQLPRELEEKILSLIPTEHIALSRCVCKRWKTHFDERRFFDTNSSPARPQFILISNSKICSVEVNLDGPSIEVHNLPFDIPGCNSSTMTVEYCDGLLFYATEYGVGICNPWLRHIRWIKSSGDLCAFSGIGYDSTKPNKHYKILQGYPSRSNNTTVIVNITEFGSYAWNSYELACSDMSSVSYYSVSLNGILYWVVFSSESFKHFIQSFDFSIGKFKPYCNLPSKYGRGPHGARSLAVYRRDRFSYLEQSCQTRDIKIWVTREKIKNGDGEAVEWMKLMNVSVPTWSSLRVSDLWAPSYFIDDETNTLVLCCLNKEKKAYICVAKGDKDFHEIEINDLVETFPLHRTYFPTLVPVPMLITNRTKHVASPLALVEVSDGVGENEWDDGFFDNAKKISIYISDSVVVSIKVVYSKDNANITGALHGIATNSPDINYYIDHDDYIETIGGTYTESHITSITFRMHKGSTYVHGSFEGMPFVLGGGQDSKIIGFYGRCSDTNLTALGVHLSTSI